ncbi:MAG: hypothetical protein ACTTIH_05965, partial [Porphyromonas gingivalis]
FRAKGLDVSGKTSRRFFEGILQTATAASRRFPGVALGLPPVRCVGSSRTRLTEGAATTCGGGLQTAGKGTQIVRFGRQ